MNLNLNTQSLGQCLKEINQIGGTTYQNICNGQHTFVAWGSLDWVVMIVAMIFLATVVALIIKAVIYI